MPAPRKHPLADELVDQARFDASLEIVSLATLELLVEIRDDLRAVRTELAMTRFDELFETKEKS